MLMEGNFRNIVFLCYAIDDQKSHRWLERIKLHFHPLMQRYQFQLWDDSKIQPGTDWQLEITKAIDHALAAILLVGPAFLSSDFIVQVELPRLLKRAREDGMKLFILLTQDCHFEKSDIKDCQVFKEENRPLTPLEKLSASRQNGVLKVFTGTVISALEGQSLGRHWRICHNLNAQPANVFGRDREEEALFTVLKDPKKPIVLMSGFGGVGKSTMANMVAWKYVERQEPFRCIVWIDLRQYGQRERSKPTFSSVLNIIAKVMDTSGEVVTIGDTEIKAARIREILAATRSLLIFDNYEALLAEPLEEESVAHFIDSLPIGPQSDENSPFIRVLITTRIVSQALSLLPIHNEKLQSLLFKDSLKMMKSQMNAPKLTQQQWKYVWGKLHGLPKYMQIAVRQLTQMTFSDWEKMVTQIKWQPKKPDDFFFDLFDYSWRNPTIISEDLRRILLAMTYFAGHARRNELCRTSGLQGHRFRDVLSSGHFTAYVEIIRDRSRKEWYAIHPLMHAYCRAALNSNEFRKFREESSVHFVHCFVDLAKRSKKMKSLDLLDEESENIMAATRVAGRLKLWMDLIELRQQVGDFLRIRGHWTDYKEMVELAIKACYALGREELWAEYIVNNLAWYHLRLEDVKTACNLIKKGLRLFMKHGHRPGIAQSMRHLGKAALLNGLDGRYLPTKSAKKYFDQAERYYKKSLFVRKQLQMEGDDQRLSIADMKLDLGRLYWLQGIEFEQRSRQLRDSCLSAKALRKYKKANSLSEEARQDFEQLCAREEIVKARISKAWGNLGNATKEIAYYMGRNNAWPRAREYAEAAEYCYDKNLLLGNEISKKDEIAHALAGLVELHLFVAGWTNLSTKREEKRVLLEKMKKDAQRAHRLYEELAGPRQQIVNRPKRPAKKTRDEMRTEWLIDQIGKLQASLKE